MAHDEASRMIISVALGGIFVHVTFIIIAQMLMKHKSEEFTQTFFWPK
jgi:ABC-type lipoprotein release transport system permease subunit